MEELKDIRSEIDALDDRIIRLLGERFVHVRNAGKLKADKDIAVEQHDRVDEVLDRVADMAEEHGLDRALAVSLYRLIIAHAHQVEYAIAGS